MLNSRLKTVHLISAYPFCSILLAVLGRAESDVLLFSHLTWPMLHFGSLWYTPGFPSSTWAVWTSMSTFLRPCSPPSESQWSQHLLYFILCIMINMQSSEELIWVSVMMNFPNIQHLQFSDLTESHSYCININHSSYSCSIPLKNTFTVGNLLLQGDWTSWLPEVPSNSCNSVILW